MKSKIVKPEQSAKRGCLVATLVFGPVLYILAPVPLSLLFSKLPRDFTQYVQPVYDVVFAPIDWAYQNSSIVRAFYDWQMDLAGLM